MVQLYEWMSRCSYVKAACPREHVYSSRTVAPEATPRVVNCLETPKRILNMKGMLTRQQRAQKLQRRSETVCLPRAAQSVYKPYNDNVFLFMALPEVVIAASQL